MGKINILTSDFDYRKLAEFIIKENYSHHHQTNVFSDQKTKAVYEEEIYYRKNSLVFALQDSQDTLIGTIRALKWNYCDLLPLEKIFSIHPFQVIEKNFEGEIWHIGKFAIRKNEGLLPLKKLMALAIGSVCEKEKNIAFAECDSKLLKTLYLMGIEPVIIGTPKYYLGSETVPVLLVYDNLIKFYHKHEYLINDECDIHTHPILNSALESNTLCYSFT